MPRLTLLLFSLALVAAPAARAGEKPPPGWFRPDPSATQPPYTIVGSAFEVTSKGVRVRVEPLDDAQRKAYLTLRTSLGVDPFPTRAQYPAGPNIFAVSIQNGSASDLTYQPTLSQLFRNRDHEVFPIAADQLFTFLRSGLQAAEDPDQAAIRALDIFHAHRLTLKPGESATRLLVFEAAPPGTTQVLLLLDQITVGAEEVRLAFPLVTEEALHSPRKRPSLAAYGVSEE